MGLYRLLLHVYPRSFRAEYGDEMCAIFAQRQRSAAGVGVRLLLWLEALGDVVANAMRVHADLLAQDLRYTVRALARSRGFAATAILVSALGIGATTAAFSVADHVLLRPLPFPESDRLVKLWLDQSFRGYPRLELSPANYLDWKRLATSFDGMAAYNVRFANLVGHGDPERLDATLVTPDTFAVLQVQAARGRTLTSADDRDDAAPAAVLSDTLWRSKFGADPNILGRAIVLDDTSFVVVGIMPAGFEFPSRDIDVWLPLRFSPESLRDRADWYLQAVGRLRRSVTLAAAQSEMRVIAAQLEREYPRENARTSATVHLLRDQVSVQARTMLIVLVAASVCMLLIACVNLANLMLARALARQREMAVRAAIGAGWERLVRQMLTESLGLAVVGGALGVLLAVAATPLISRLVPTTLPIADVPSVDLRMLALAAMVTLCTGVGFGVLPALRVTRNTDPTSLREGARSGASRATERLRSALVIGEVTASVVLLVAAALLIRALWQVQQIDPGFKADNVLTLRTALPLPKYAETERRQQFYDRVIGGIRALPGVTQAGYSTFLPMVFGGGIWAVSLDGREPPPEETKAVSLRFITPGYFGAMSIPLLRGRNLDDADSASAPFVAVVSDSFARRFLPGQDPIGRKFFVAFAERTIVGIVGDVRVRGLERDNSEPQVYVPSRQVRDGGLSFYTPKDLVVSASVPVTTLVPAIRQIVAKADPAQPISDVRTLSDVVELQTAARRAQLRVLTAFAAMAFLLAGVGVHGLLAFAVSSRTREIGVRMALGARSTEIVAMVMRRGLWLATVGIALGTVLAFAAGRALQAILAGVSPADPLAFASAAVLTASMAIFGCLLPALRALRVDPVTAIRAE
jgi:predicted permease